MELILLQHICFYPCKYHILIGGSVKGRQILGKYPETFQSNSEEYPNVLSRGKAGNNSHPLVMFSLINKGIPLKS